MRHTLFVNLFPGGNTPAALRDAEIAMANVASAIEAHHPGAIVRPVVMLNEKASVEYVHIRLEVCGTDERILETARRLMPPQCKVRGGVGEPSPLPISLAFINGFEAGAMPECVLEHLVAYWMGLCGDGVSHLRLREIAPSTKRPGQLEVVLEVRCDARHFQAMRERMRAAFELVTNGDKTVSLRFMK